VDDEDFERINAFKWCAHWDPSVKSFYAVRCDVSGKRRRNVRMARFIMHTPKGMICDHIYHDTLDNRKSELRNCTPSQSTMNTKMRSKNIIGFKHISHNGKYYSVRIKRNGKYLFHKTFRNFKQAVAARDEALKKYHGEFAYSGNEPSKDLDQGP
jgi:hemin uptake protein HemP